MKKKTKIYLIILIIFVVGIILIFTNQYSPIKKLISNTTPIIPSDTQNYSNLNPQNEKKTDFIIDWSKAQIINPINSYPVYTYKSLFESSNINKIANLMGFLDSQKQDIMGNSIWKTDDKKYIFLYTPKEKALNYQHNIDNQSGSVFDEKKIQQTVLDTLNTIFPSIKIKIKKTTYLLKNNNSPSVSIEKAEQIKIDVDQLIGDFPIIPQTLINSNFSTFFLNKESNIIYFTINDGISSTIETSTKRIFNFDSLKKVSLSSFVNITPLRINQEDIINQSKEIIYQVEKIEPAYIPINNTISPVYLISGKIIPVGKTPIPETVQYISPMNN